MWRQRRWVSITFHVTWIQQNNIFSKLIDSYIEIISKWHFFIGWSHHCDHNAMPSKQGGSPVKNQLLSSGMQTLRAAWVENLAYWLQKSWRVFLIAFKGFIFEEEALFSGLKHDSHLGRSWAEEYWRLMAWGAQHQ